MNVCKDMLKNCSNPEVKALLRRKLYGDDDNARVTDSIKSKAKELRNNDKWQPSGYAGNNFNSQS